LHSQNYEAPQGEIEGVLATIWQQLLHLEPVGRHDNFFELGGDSILGIQVVARARQAGLGITVAELFQYQTLAELAEVAEWQGLIASSQEVVSGEVTLTPIQRWFFEQQSIDRYHYNQSVLLEVRQTLSPKVMEQVVRELLRHHDALRMRFYDSGGIWRQLNLEHETGTAFIQVDLSELSSDVQNLALEETAGQLQASLDLGQGPMVRVALFNYGEAQTGRLLLIIHHLVVDGVSWRILLEDMEVIYRQLERGETVHIGSKTSSFQQWAERLPEYAQSETLQQELEYWLKQGPQAGDGALPAGDEANGNELGNEVARISIQLTAEETQMLLQQVPAAYHTQINDVLLTALAEALSAWSRSEVVRIDLEGHGREELFGDIDLTRTVGWFTTFFPVRLELLEHGGLGTKLRAVKEQLRRVPQHGIGYGLLRYLCRDAKVSKQLQAMPEAEVSFNYLGQLDQVLMATRFGPA